MTCVELESRLYTRRARERKKSEEAGSGERVSNEE